MRDAIKTKEVAIKYIPTDKMIVDPLTKSIPRNAFKVHSLSLGLRVKGIYEIKIKCSFSKCFVIYLLDMLKSNRLLIGLVTQAIALTLE